MFQFRSVLLSAGLILPCSFLILGCSTEPQGNAQSPRGDEGPPPPPLVDIAVVSPQGADNALSYVGTTSPQQTVSLRSRVEGQVLLLTADIGDAVTQGELIAQLDSALLKTRVGEARAELSARQSDVEQAKFQLAEARAQVERAKAELKQAEANAARLQELVGVGAISLQDAEVANTSVRTAVEVLNAAQEQVRTRERAIASLERRVGVQGAIVEQVSEQLTYATLNAPLTGIVLAREVEPGDVVQQGQALLTIGDLSAVNVDIEVSDRDLSQFRLGQSVTVRLDAFPEQRFTGSISQISPVANAPARLVPIEVTLPNPDQRISSGLLARVSLDSDVSSSVLIPETAIHRSTADNIIVYVPSGNPSDLSVTPRPVTIGELDNGKVEILSGLRVGESYIVKSDHPLEPGQSVRRSFLSN